MIVVAAVSLALVVVIVAAIRLNMAIADTRERFRVLAAGYGDAGLLVSARNRFRRRQESVEQVVDTGTVGLQTAHRTISGWFGTQHSADGIYDNVRAFNRNVGRALSGLFAPGPKKRSESLQEWREKQDSTARRDRADDES